MCALFSLCILPMHSCLLFFYLEAGRFIYGVESVGEQLDGIKHNVLKVKKLNDESTYFRETGRS